MNPVGERAAPRQTAGFSTRAQIVAAGCACAGFSTFLFEVNPHQHGVYPPCLLYQATGIYCAGCGATRAAYALLHGRVLEALHDNLLFTLLLPVALGWLAFYVGEAWRAQAWPAVRLGQKEALTRGGVFLALSMAFMIARNLPGSPFSWLRPT